MNSSITKQKSDGKNRLKETQEYFKEYCNATSIHGFRYFGEDRSIIERLWWAIIFAICLSGCGVMIYKIYEKWERSPVIVTFATKETPIYQIPFPAVTICPETKSDQRIFNYTRMIMKNQSNLTTNSTENQYFNYMSLVCDSLGNNTIKSSSNQTYSTEFFEFLEKVKPDFLNYTYDCQFMGKIYDCQELFTPIITDEGICYSFNILDRSEIFQELVVHYKNYHKTKEMTKLWSMEKGYLPSAVVNTYPRRALLAGATNALTVHLITPKNNMDYRCKGIQGYRVLLHTPMRMPRLKQEYFRIPLDQAVVTAVQPVMITTSEAVKAYEPHKRECCFPSERQLRYFKIYSQLNCQLECLTNYTLKLCGCVNFFMPRDENTSICGTGNVRCMDKAEKSFQAESLLFMEFPENSHQAKQFDCDCMPICTDLSYNIETSQTNWNWDWHGKFRTLNGTKFNRNTVHLSSLTIFFKFNHFITSERNELYGPTDFLANFGGLLGLFTGFSILSLMELIYFLSLRIICNMKLFGKWIGGGK